MKHGWEYRRLIDVCTGASTINWDTASSKQYIDLSSVDRESHKVSDTTTICKADAPSRAKQIVKMGDVIFGTTRPLLKRVCLVAPEYDKQVCSTGFCVLRPQKMVLPMWVYYCLQTDRFYSYIEPLQKGISYPAVSNDDVRNYVIPLPPLPVQEQICSLLDKLSRVIEAKKEQLKELDNLAQAIFYDMFGDPVENNKGWESKPIGSIGELSRGVSKHRPRNAPELLGGTMPLIQTGDVSNSGMYIRDYSSTYSELGVLQSRVWHKGTLCITIAANIGKCSILTFDACFPDSVVGFIPYDNALVEYMFFAFSAIQKTLEENAMGVAQKNINLAILNQLVLAVPPLDKQQAFAEKVEAIERQKELINQSIREVQTLFDSRMDYWFSD